MRSLELVAIQGSIARFVGRLAPRFDVNSTNLGFPFLSVKETRMSALFRSVVFSSFVMASCAATAANADICYGPNYALTGAASPATNATVFNCPQAGQKTLPQLAAEGWQVVQMSPIVVSQTQGADQLIIQRP